MQRSKLIPMVTSHAAKYEKKKEEQWVNSYTWFVVAVIMLIGRVKINAMAAAKMSPHHGI